MAKAFSSVTIAAPARDVWTLIGGFGSLPDWLALIPKSELGEGGRVRHLTLADGGTIIERLMAFDEEERSYSYRILQSPFPQKDYLATLRVSEAEGGKAALVEWFGRFTPVGVKEAEVTSLFQGIYDNGLDALRTRFEA